MLGLAKLLGRAGVASPNGRARWSPATLRGMLTNPATPARSIAGRTRASRPVSGAPHSTQSADRGLDSPDAGGGMGPRGQLPALVSAEQFARVQTKLAHNRHLPGATTRRTTTCCAPWSVAGVCLHGRCAAATGTIIMSVARRRTRSPRGGTRSVPRAISRPVSSTSSSGRICARC